MPQPPINHSCLLSVQISLSSRPDNLGVGWHHPTVAEKLDDDGDVSTDRTIAATQPEVALTVDGIRQSECRPTGLARPEERSMTLMSPTRPVTMAEVRTVTDDVTHLSIGQGETETGQPEVSLTRSDPSLYLETATDSPWAMTMPTGQNPYGQINIAFHNAVQHGFDEGAQTKQIDVEYVSVPMETDAVVHADSSPAHEHTPVENCGEFGAIVLG